MANTGFQPPKPRALRRVVRETIIDPDPIAMDLSDHLAQCHTKLQQSVAALGADAQSPRLAQIADLIIQSMTGPWRSFHTPQHIFDVGCGGSAVEVIAALFHDLVYVQVDSGIQVNLSRYVAPYVREVKPQSLVIDSEPHESDTGFRLALALFGFKPGQSLSPFAGQNEFLSAVVAVKALEGLLSWRDLAQVVVCIEATIPFRATAADGRTPEACMHERLCQVNQAMGLGLSAQECTHAVEMGVRVANRDIGNFGSEHPAEFLNNTWNLIPETNHDLVQVNTFSIRGYRISLQKMEGFLSFLKPEVVFRRYGQEPNQEDHLRRQALTQRNLEVAVQYLRVKLVAIGLLEALSQRMGCDVSLTSIMGQRSDNTGQHFQLERQLPPVSNAYIASNPTEAYVMDLLERGRSADSVYDTRHSPVSSFLVKSLGMDEVMRMLSPTRAFFANPTQSEALLADWSPQALAAIQQAMMKVFVLRTQALQGQAPAA